MSALPTIRAANPADLPLLEGIERRADIAFIERFSATDWPPAVSGVARAAEPGFLLVAESAGAVVGFAHVLEPAFSPSDPPAISRLAHLEQLAVTPEAGRRGIGSQLLAAAGTAAHERGAEMLTLRTYRDVPWNGPFYIARGFTEYAPDRAFLLELAGAERAEGIDVYGARVLLARCFSNPVG